MLNSRTAFILNRLATLSSVTKGTTGFGVALRFFVASGVSRIIILRRACEKPHKIREFEPTHVGCYAFVASGVSRIIFL